MKSDWPADKVKRRKVADLVPYARNARTHSDEQVGQIAASIREWGWTTPVLVDEDGGIIAGHARVMAAQKLGIEDVPCMVAAGWTEAQKRAYVIADNKLALNAGWDTSLLKTEIGMLSDQGFDLGLTGFSDKELGSLFDEDEGVAVHEVESSDVADRFWISIRGPLAQQAEALKRLQEVMDDLESIEVELGTIALDF